MKVAMFADKLDLICQGRMVEASNIVVKKQEDDPFEEDNPVSGIDDDLEEDDRSVHWQGKDVTQEKKRGLTTIQVDAIKDVTDQFLGSMPNRKCENCSAHVPTVKSEGVGKLLQV
jgi:hypothetical protein